MVRTQYLHKAFEERKVVLEQATFYLAAHAHRFDAIAVRGVSGLLIGPSLADRLGKPFVVVRKLGESTHSPRTLEGWVAEGSRYLFVDDFVVSGDTCAAVKRAVEGAGGTVVGEYLYRDHKLNWYETGNETIRCGGAERPEGDARAQDDTGQGPADRSEEQTGDPGANRPSGGSAERGNTLAGVRGISGQGDVLNKGQLGA